jgi:hypothetical protein
MVFQRFLPVNSLCSDLVYNLLMPFPEWLVCKYDRKRGRFMKSGISAFLHFLIFERMNL